MEYIGSEELLCQCSLATMNASIPPVCYSKLIKKYMDMYRMNVKCFGKVVYTHVYACVDGEWYLYMMQ